MLQRIEAQVVAVPVVHAVARTGRSTAGTGIFIDTAVVAWRAAAVALVVARLICLHRRVSSASLPEAGQRGGETAGLPSYGRGSAS